MIVIRQAPVNRETGEPQKSELVLFENDELQLTDQLDARLRRARQVKVVVTDKSRGAVSAQFPGRSWEVLADGPDIRDRLIEFSDGLTEHARSWIFSSRVAQLLILTPALLVIVAGAEWGAVVTSKGKEVLVHHWVTDFYNVILFGIGPICWATAFVILIVMAYGGAMGIWPDTFTRRSLTEGLYRVRTALITPVSIAAFVSAVITSVISAVLAAVIH
jgi:hypothetical protein